MNIIDLRSDRSFLEAYVALRNANADYLLTKKVAMDETLKWIDEASVEVRLLIMNNKQLAGAVVVYLDRGGEVAFFAREQNKGTGTRLLEIADQIACMKSCALLWSWVRADNKIAQRVFEKNSYKIIERAFRSFEGRAVDGFVFEKKLRRYCNNG